MTAIPAPPRSVPRALLMAVLCHGVFALAVGSMAFALATGLRHGAGRLEGAWAFVANVALVAQFPLVHSWLLSGKGRPWLAKLSPFGHGRTLAPSTFAISGSLQLLAAFWLWSPSGVVWHEPSGAIGAAQWAVFGAAWLFLHKALFDAGLALQTGAAGWWALLRGRSVDYGEMPTRGLFATCRQPIYLGFALVLWTAPTWTPDWLLLAVGWSAYCVVGPRLKESRWQRRFGERFVAYQRSVPYLLPRLFR